MRTTRAPAGVLPAVRRAIADADPGLAVLSPAPLDALLDGPRAQPRLAALALALFALAAVVVAGVGLFAIVATVVRQRSRELGIRMALGATAGRIGAMTLGRGVALAATGSAIGLAVAIAGGRLLAALLFETSPTDAGTLALVAILLLTIAVLASLVPARLSMRADPLAELRAAEAERRRPCASVRADAS